ncbi:MAG: cytidine deaminase, partial [Candidatus Tectomicrobia bacterium]|nr:cytidine deaminase [Candidatus Tectomicrobia bacterium]
LHAEQNAILQAALHGVSVKEAVLYCTHHPCSLCAKMLVNAGVRKILYAQGYPDPLASEILEEAQLERLRLSIGEGEEG